MKPPERNSDLSFYPIMKVPDDAASASEAMGSKQKFWYEDAAYGRCLFKQGRPGTGEDWAEKIACEIAKGLSIPCAKYELAAWRDQTGTVSVSMVPATGILIHGNEILRRVTKNYPTGQHGSRVFQRVREHTFDVILGVHKRGVRRLEFPLDWTPIKSIQEPWEVFIGYFLLDALVGNTDRHHENWGFVFLPERIHEGVLPLFIAPTFDHASCLGRELTDDERLQRLRTKDKAYSVESYADRARSAIFADRNERKPLLTSEVFKKCLDLYPEPSVAWMHRLSSLPDEFFAGLFERIPEERITSPARNFALNILEHNRSKLLNLMERQ